MIVTCVSEVGFPTLRGRYRVRCVRHLVSLLVKGRLVAIFASLARMEFLELLRVKSALLDHSLVSPRVFSATWADFLLPLVRWFAMTVQLERLQQCLALECANPAALANLRPILFHKYAALVMLVNSVSGRRM